MLDTLIVISQTLHILTLGDSNGSFPYSWPAQLQPHAQVCNISKPGRTIGFVNNGDSTANSLMMIDENLKKANAAYSSYDYVILELGTNDAKAVFKDKQDEVPVNLGKLINRIKTCPYPGISKATIIIISPPPYGVRADTTVKYNGANQRAAAMSKAFARVAADNHCLFVNGYLTPGLNIETMTNDGLHLDEAGSRKLIEPVLPLLKHKKGG